MNNPVSKYKEVKLFLGIHIYTRTSYTLSHPKGEYFQTFYEYNYLSLFKRYKGRMYSMGVGFISLPNPESGFYEFKKIHEEGLI